MINPANIPLSLYIHVPWCIRKCPYCDFNSHQADVKTLPEADYLAALTNDIDQEIATYNNVAISEGLIPATTGASLVENRNIDGHLLENRPIETIFIGGGTPSLLSAEFYQQLFDTINSKLNLSPNVEITLEANPGSLEQANFPGFRKASINRLSIGVQSLNDNALQKLGRVHTASAAQQAFVAAREAGFNNINLDLMFGLSGQSKEDAFKDLKSAISLQPEHISWYQLTIEPNTVFYSKPPTLPNEDLLYEMSEEGQKLLEAAGYKRYEISAYAREGKQAQHNLNYWRFGDYMGIGAGAHGKLSYNDKIMRCSKRRMPNEYMEKQDKLASQEVIATEQLPLEYMLNVLRLTGGFELKGFVERTGLAENVIRDQLNALIAKGLLSESLEGCKKMIIPTEQGMQFHNELVASFIPE